MRSWGRGEGAAGGEVQLVGVQPAQTCEQWMAGRVSLGGGGTGKLPAEESWRGQEEREGPRERMWTEWGRRAWVRIGKPGGMNVAVAAGGAAAVGGSAAAAGGAGVAGAAAAGAAAAAGTADAAAGASIRPTENKRRDFKSRISSTVNALAVRSADQVEWIRTNNERLNGSSVDSLTQDSTRVALHKSGFTTMQSGTWGPQCAMHSRECTALTLTCAAPAAAYLPYPLPPADTAAAAAPAAAPCPE